MNKTLISLFLVSITSIVTAKVLTLEDRIVGGTNASILDFPYQVSLRSKDQHVCGGSIFSNSYVLTAAHCVMEGKPSQYSIRAGSDYVNKDGKIIKVCKFWPHKDYNGDTMDSDIAVVKLCSPLTFTERISPIALPEPGEEVEEGTIALVSGWGRDKEAGSIGNTLQQVEVPIIAFDTCKKIYEDIVDLTDNMFCAGFLDSGGKDACQGDSGGPLKANGKLMGIISWSFGCGQKSYPGVYTKVSNYRSWIRSIANN